MKYGQIHETEYGPILMDFYSNLEKELNARFDLVLNSEVKGGIGDTIFCALDDFAQKFIDIEMSFN